MVILLVEVIKGPKREVPEIPTSGLKVVQHLYIEDSQNGASSTCKYEAPLKPYLRLSGGYGGCLCFSSTAKNFAPLPISRLQRWLSSSRLSPSEPITIRSVVHSNLVHGISHLNGVKLLGDVDPSLPLPPLIVHLSQFSKSAAKAILDAGGEVKAVYRNALGLRQEIFPRRFEGKEVKYARPTRRSDIGEYYAILRATLMWSLEYYTDPARFGYLADQKEAFFEEIGFEPKSAINRPASAKAAGRA